MKHFVIATLVVVTLVSLYVAADRAEHRRYVQGCVDYGAFTGKPTAWNELMGCIDKSGKPVSW